MEILDVNGKVIPEDWKREFAGLFAGEGCLYLGKLTRKGKTKSHVIYLPQAIISMRSDELPLLLEIQRVLGGDVTQKSDTAWKNRKNEWPRHRWIVASKEALLRVASLLEDTLLPAKKWRELPYWKEAILLRKNRGEKHTDEENLRLQELFQTIRDIRVFKVR